MDYNFLLRKPVVISRIWQKINILIFLLVEGIGSRVKNKSTMSKLSNKGFS